MSEQFPETTSPADALNEALVGFTGCIAESVPDICSYSLTIGDDYMPFRPDEDDDCDDDAEDGACSQMWVRVESIVPTSVSESFSGDDCTAELSINLEVGIMRCVTVEADGEAPRATDMLLAAVQAMEDMNAMFCAAMSCEVWDSISVGQWTPDGPLGGQYGGRWTFTVSGPQRPPAGS